MTTQSFKASVQYNDFKGTSAADRADSDDAEKWLSDNGFIEADEFLVGISVFVGENHGEHEDPVFVEFLVDPSPRDIAQIPGTPDAPIDLKRIRVDMEIKDFLSLFKRFSVTLSIDGMLEGKSYRYDD